MRLRHRPHFRVDRPGDPLPRRKLRINERVVIGLPWNYCIKFALPIIEDAQRIFRRRPIPALHLSLGVATVPVIQPIELDPGSDAELGKRPLAIGDECAGLQVRQVDGLFDSTLVQ